MQGSNLHSCDKYRNKKMVYIGHQNEEQQSSYGQHEAFVEFLNGCKDWELNPYILYSIFQYRS